MLSAPATPSLRGCIGFVVGREEGACCLRCWLLRSGTQLPKLALSVGFEWQASGLDVTQLPCQKHAQKEHNGQPYACGERPRHAFAAFAVVVGAFFSAHHEEERRSEARKNGQKGEGDQEFHGVHYYVNTNDVPSLGWRFWIITLAALVTMAVTASLGRWQLSRAAQKEALQLAMDQRMAGPPLSVQQFIAGLNAMISASALNDAQTDPLLHRPVQLSGQWIANRTVYLDNRQMNGKQGFFVMTPLRLNGFSDAVVMVQRGWVPRNFEDRTRLPELRTPTGEVQILGRVMASPARLYEFDTSGNAARDSVIRQNLDLVTFGAETGLPLMPLSVVQTTGNADDGLLRDWPAVDSGVDKHYGYAFQWFGLCALVAILYVWFQLIRRFLRPRSQPSA